MSRQVMSPTSSPRSIRSPETLVRRPQPLPSANSAPLGAVESHGNNLGTRPSGIVPDRYSQSEVDPSHIAPPSPTSSVLFQRHIERTRAHIDETLQLISAQYRDDMSTAETKYKKAQRELNEERQVTRQLRAALNESSARARNAMVYARVLEDYVRAVEVYLDQDGSEDNGLPRLQASEHIRLSPSRASRREHPAPPPRPESASLSGYSNGTPSKLKRSHAEYENGGQVHAESWISSPEKVLKTS